VASSRVPFDTKRSLRKKADYSEREFHHEGHEGHKEEFDYYEG
jgi:hypothetical protein